MRGSSGLWFSTAFCEQEDLQTRGALSGKVRRFQKSQDVGISGKGAGVSVERHQQPLWEGQHHGVRRGCSRHESVCPALPACLDLLAPAMHAHAQT